MRHSTFRLALRAGLMLFSGLVPMTTAMTIATPVLAQSTTSAMTGVITDFVGNPVSGADVRIIHVPTGTVSRDRTNNQGRFTADNLRPGGPYKVTVTATDYAPREEENIFIALGRPFEISLSLQPVGTRVESTITVSGDRLQTIETGTVSTFSAQQIEDAATQERRLQEIARLDPKAFVDLGDDLEDQGISLLGFNTRFNNVVVDGISLVDSFGTTFSGLATSGSPISLDAIESFSVETAPFDVQNSNFTGGQINIVTRSGTNELDVRAFYSRAGGTILSGDRAGPEDFNRRDASDRWAITISGPIIKDKLFFLVNYEENRQFDGINECPIGFGCGNEEDAVPLALFDQVRQASIDTFDFDPGDFADFNSLPNFERKILGRLDWNITNDHRASLTFQRTISRAFGQGDADANGANGLAAPSTFSDNESSIPQSYSFQLFSNWTDRLSTEFRFNFQEQTQATIPVAGFEIGQILINGLNGANNPATGSPFIATIELGSENNVQNNILDLERFQYKFRAQYEVGRHRFSAGYERDTRNVFEILLDGSEGIFTFNDPDAGGPLTGLDAFIAGGPANVVFNTSVTGVAADTAANFNLTQNSFYVQDEINITDRLSVLIGLRYERFGISETPPLNEAFALRNGFPNTATLDNLDVFAPRFGFNYRATDWLTVRGGGGIFAGGFPLSFVSQTFDENGVTTRSATVNGLTGVNPFDTPPQIVTALEGALANPASEGNVTALDPDFEIPSLWRVNVAVDTRFDIPFIGKGFNATFEFIGSFTRNALQFQDLRLVELAQSLPTGDPRFTLPPQSVDPRTFGPAIPAGNPAFNPVTGAGFGANGDPPGDFLVTNTGLGRSIVGSFSIDKTWDFTGWGELAGRIGYAFTDNEDVSPANDTDDTRDVFETGAFVNINDPGLGDQNIQSGRNRFIYDFSFTRRWGKGWNTRIGIFGEFRSGRATSFTFNDPVTIPGESGSAAVQAAFQALGVPDGLQRIQPGLSTTARDRLNFFLPSNIDPTNPNGTTDPFVRFIPTVIDPPGAVNAQVNATVAQNAQNLLDIVNFFNLQEFQGGFIPRNALRAEPSNIIDLSFRQDIPVKFGRLSLTADIRNLLNLIDRNRGTIARFDIREEIADGFFDPATNQFVITAVDTLESLIIERDDLTFGSVWSARLGIRYNF